MVPGEGQLYRIFGTLYSPQLWEDPMTHPTLSYAKFNMRNDAISLMKTNAQTGYAQMQKYFYAYSSGFIYPDDRNFCITKKLDY